MRYTYTDHSHNLYKVSLIRIAQVAMSYCSHDDEILIIFEQFFRTVYFKRAISLKHRVIEG